MNNTATTRTIHILCEADGTPVMRGASRFARPEFRHKTYPVCFGGTRANAEAWMKGHYKATQVISITWEVK